MPDISMDQHNFSKTNLVTRAGKMGDHYKCTACGLEGDRVGLKPFIRVKKDKTCTRVVQKVALPDRVQVTYCASPGFVTEGREYDRVEVPAQYAVNPKYINNVWVFSELRNEPVMLMSNEYEPVELSAKEKLFKDLDAI